MSQPPDAETKAEIVTVDAPTPVAEPPITPDVLVPGTADDPMIRSSVTPAIATALPATEPFVTLPAWGLWTIVALAAIYLGNFTMGVDLIPDALPGVGNLDEVAAFMLGQQAWVALHQGVSRIFRLKPPEAK